MISLGHGRPCKPSGPIRRIGPRLARASRATASTISRDEAASSSRMDNTLSRGGSTRTSTGTANLTARPVADRTESAAFATAATIDRNQRRTGDAPLSLGPDRRSSGAPSASAEKSESEPNCAGDGLSIAGDVENFCSHRREAGATAQAQAVVASPPGPSRIKGNSHAGNSYVALVMGDSFHLRPMRLRENTAAQARPRGDRGQTCSFPKVYPNIGQTSSGKGVKFDKFSGG